MFAKSFVMPPLDMSREITAAVKHSFGQVSQNVDLYICYLIHK